MSKLNKTRPSLNPNGKYSAFTVGTAALDLTSDEALDEYEQSVKEGKSIVIMDDYDNVVFNNEKKS